MRKNYARAGGLQGFNGAAVSILAPALGALLLACGGLDLVLIVDLATFAVAFLVLLFLIRIRSILTGRLTTPLQRSREPIIPYRII